MNTSNKQIVVIYHRADFDGIFCREIARNFLGNTAEYIGWHYGDATPEVSPHVTLYMLDISVAGLMDHPGLIWIDHHKSAIEQYKAHIPGYRIDGVAACRLAWQWFDTLTRNTGSPLGAAEMTVFASKAEFVERLVREPLAVRLAGEYDIWDRRDPRAELFQHGLRSQELSEGDWNLLLEKYVTPAPANQFVADLLAAGAAIQYATTRSNESIIKELGFTFTFEGLTVLACNHARYNSHLFTAGLRPEHDACFGFKYHPRGDWEISLYHAPGKEHHDLSVIAKKYGGGGHRGACGFRLKTLPFSREAILRTALEQLVGASTKEDLQQMQEVLAALPDCENKTVALPAVRALLETL